MSGITRVPSGALLLVGLFSLLVGARAALAAEAGTCQGIKIEDAQPKPLQAVTLPPGKRCVVRMHNGFLLPDPACTPGAINPALTIDVLQNPEFRTTCVRNQTTTEVEKEQTYGWYATMRPAQNSGVTQTCELDHLISLELGGADTLENIWP